MSAAEVAKETFWHKKLVRDIDVQKGLERIIVIGDSQGSLKANLSPVSHRRAKRIDERRHFIRDEVKKGSIKFARCDTDEMITDFLTKGAPRQKQEFCSKGVGLAD